MRLARLARSNRPGFAPDKKADDRRLLIWRWNRDTNVVEVVCVQAPEAFDDSLARAQFLSAMRRTVDGAKVVVVCGPERAQHRVVWAYNHRSSELLPEPEMCLEAI